MNARKDDEYEDKGPVCRTTRAGFWWAGVPRAHWPTEEERRREIQSIWEEPYGDRRQELVLIGIGMDEASLRAALERCLLTDAEMKLGPSQWGALPAPFASWGPSVGEPSMVA